jgi:DNA modification methylase
VNLIHGDCLEVMPTLEAESVDAIVTDPPYGLGFMGKHWDHGVPAIEFWQAMWRVAKPGAYLLSFGGTRTVHWIATNIEDAGWIIRDQLSWIYASGFPKGKANLKPAHEPIVLARKPGLLRPLGIDAGRIGYQSEADTYAVPEADFAATRAVGGRHAGISAVTHGLPTYRGSKMSESHPAGRWPSNVLLSDPELFDQPNPYVVGSGATSVSRASDYDWGDSDNDNPTRIAHNIKSGVHFEDSGGYSRFFIIPKADRAERERGLADRPQVEASERHGYTTLPDKRMDRQQERTARANVHPTVKPIDLMRHLVRLVTPQGGTVLDPFLGSGTTAIACEMEGFAWIGIEREAEYVDIARARITASPRGLGL